MSVRDAIEDLKPAGTAPQVTKLKTIAEWIMERGVGAAELVTSSGLDQKVVEAIIAGRYMTSPAQRQRLAAALALSPDDVQWGKPVHVDHMYGHGPQFGRSP
jgi:hypothetical protein